MKKLCEETIEIHFWNRQGAMSGRLFVFCLCVIPACACFVPGGPVEGVG